MIDGLSLQIGVPLSLNTPGRNPEHPRRGDGIDRAPFPPGDLVAEAVDFAVMGSAQRYRELIADLAAHRARLREFQMVGVGGTSRADQTRLRCHEFEVGFVTKPTRFSHQATSSPKLWMSR